MSAMQEIVLPTGVSLRPIPIAPNDDYRAGSDGQVYSRTKYAGFGRKDRVDWYPMASRLPKKRGSRQPYKTVTLCHENRKITKAVHKLVCLAFNGPPPEATSQVRHLDGNAANCLPANLAWGTQEQNWNDRRAHGRVALGENHHATKLTNAEREHLRWALAKGLCSQRQAARMLRMSQAAIGAIAVREPTSG